MRSEKLVGFGPAIALAVLGALLFASAHVPVSVDQPAGGPDHPVVEVSEAAAGWSALPESAVPGSAAPEPDTARSGVPTTSATTLWP
ncbi:hypothetical protein [Goodfellowiella coeruleoviolacea]|uniref:hypothetical protein n=1 Tax=Goodfellowiella coeruleoviolacea TaxID=334858 RepID=UPI0020A4DCF6|nr:hypothetical protein [Goodfellowiella coeruleoviolacea]